MRLAALLLWAAVLTAAPRVTVPFDTGWRFLKGEMAGAQAPGAADTDWRSVTLPHDWAIEGPFDEKNPAGQGGAFLPAGVGWYRKHFAVPAEYAGRRVFVEFDGVMANGEVWINGASLGKRPYGYVSFRYELTDRLAKGDNVLAVRADNAQQPASRWFSGAGINRHVRLIVTDPVHIEQWATFVSTPKVSAAEATVKVSTAVVNQSKADRTVAVEFTLAGASVRSKPQTIAAGKSDEFEAEMVVQHPTLWGLGPLQFLYVATATVREAKNALDEESVSFGIRETRFDADTGFWLNGKSVKIKGVCLHADGGAVGTAVPLDVWERRLTELRRIGVNAIRLAHNPVAPEFLDLTDRMGFLVMDEMFDQWTVAKNPYDYHQYFRDWSHTDTRDTVRRDRNHPSVIVYSAGNEIHDTPHGELAKDILKGLVETFHTADPTRPVTQALFRPNVSHDYDNGLADLLDVVGQNYRENEILAAHQQKPARKILGTENGHERRVWLALRDNKEYAGQFLWSGIDYLGEGRIWPYTTNASGLLDRTGSIKPIGWERMSWWSDSPMVHVSRRVSAREAAPTDPGYETARRQTQTLFDDWSPANREPHPENVEVYSNCEEVELLLNGRSLGSKPLARDASPRNWRVDFAPGKVEAVCRNQGKVAAVSDLRTAGKAARIALSVDKVKLPFGWDSVAYLNARVTDENGVTVPDAVHKITFAVEGPGVIAAVDNADTASHEGFQGNERSAFQGWCIAILKASRDQGTITVRVSAAGLAGTSLKVEAAK
jgi:beta-galactosidase